MATNWGADSPIWAMLAGGGAGMLSAGPGQSQLGGGLMGMLQGGQMAQQMQQAKQTQALREMQMAQMKREQEAEERYRNAVSPQPVGPQYAMANGAGPGRVGPTTQAAAGMSQEGNPLLAGLPAPMRSLLPNLPMSAGVQLIGQSLNREAKTPTVQEFYDEKGAPYKAQYVNGQWQKVGGSKTDDQLVKVLNPDGTIRYVPRSQAVGQAAPDEAMIVMGPDGKPMFARGGSQSVKCLISGLTNSSQSKVEEQLIDMTAQTAQVNRIASQFKPEYQQVGTRAGLTWARIRDKGGMNLDPTERQQVADFAKYRAEAGQFFADRLKAMSGAAVTEQEMKRQEAYLPTPGTGIFDGDSPTEFAAKTKRMQEFMTNATARLHYVSKKGMSIKDVSLDEMPKVIRSRGNELAGEFGKRGLDGDALKSAVRQQLAREFGLVGD
jgi:hypothetical protein